MAGSIAGLLAKAEKAKKLGKAVLASGLGMMVLWMSDEAKRRIRNKFGAK